MARVRMEEIIDHLSSEMKKALAEAVERQIPGVQFDRTALFKEFKRAVRKKCSTWERVPDSYVEAD